MPAFPQLCGLIAADSRRPVSLQEISVDVLVEGFVADVSATLKYKNEEEKALKAIFVFPMDEDSAVYSFEATVEGKIIVADLQEKKQAQEIYDAAIRQGQQEFLLEEREDSSDIFDCSVGNLAPGQVAEVTIKYVQELALEADEAVRFVLPAVLNPRYTPADQAVSMTATRPQVPIGEIPYTLSLRAHVHSAYGIAKMESNCDTSPVVYTHGKRAAKLSLAEGHKFDRDVEILAYYVTVYKPYVAVEAGLDWKLAVPGSFMSIPIAMTILFPRFPAPQEKVTGGEFIFLMDQSGSMNSPINSERNAPPRIQSAKETLILLLKSLPLGCYFNVFGFGLNCMSFFSESLKYTQETMEEAVKKVMEMKADFGRTEILLPLRTIYSTWKLGHSKQVFVFTDGDVGNTKEAIKEVAKNARNNRCFTFGIGEGASRSLIKGMAQAGGGTYDFITGKDRIQSKVLRALRCALQPSVTNVSLTWTLPPGLEASVLSKVPTTIFQGRRLIIYSQLKGNMVKDSVMGCVFLQYKLNGEQIINFYNFPLNLRNVHRPTIHRLAAKALISKMEYRVDTESKEVKKRILETSLQSGVISSLTAFVGVNKDTKIPVVGPPVRREPPISALGSVAITMSAVDGLFGSTGVPCTVGELFGSTGIPCTVGELFGSTGIPCTGGLSGGTVFSLSEAFTFGSAPSSGLLFGNAPSTGTYTSGGAPSSEPSLFGFVPSTGTPAFGSAPSSGTSIRSAPSAGSFSSGGAPSSGTSLFGSAPSTGTPAFGSPPSSGRFLFGSSPSSGTSIRSAPSAGLFTLGDAPAPSSGTSLFERAPSTGTPAFGSPPSSGRFLFGSSPSSGTSIRSAPSAGTSLFGSAPSAGTPAFGSAPSSGRFLFRSSPSSGTLFGSAPSKGTFTFGCTRPSDNPPDELEKSTHMELILLQKANGSWSPSPELAAVLGISERDLEDKKPDPGADLSVWTTLLAVIWLHSNCVEQKDEWELLSKKAVTWIKSKIGSYLSHWVKAGIELLKSSMDLTALGL